MAPPFVPKVIDIRGKSSSTNTRESLKAETILKFQSKSVPFKDHRLVRNKKHAPTAMLRSLPTMLLYSDAGLDIFDRITYNPDYYLTNAEIDIFERYSTLLVSNYIQDGHVMIELGCGAMRKTKYLLEKIAQSKKHITYYAVDLSETSLKESLIPLMAAFPGIDFVGLHGTYHDSINWIKTNVPSTARKVYLWLGSSIGNLNRAEAAAFMKMVQEDVCGIDKRNSYESVSLAYNDRQGQTKEFIFSGLEHANQVFGKETFSKDLFEYVSIYNEIEGRHEAYYESKVDQTIEIADNQFQLVQGELINVEYSYKYSKKEVLDLVHSARLYHVGEMVDSKDQYGLHLFQKPEFFIPRQLQKKGYKNIDNWKELWKAWDTFTVNLIPKENLLKKPISLRHPYIFYLGHIPGFLDIQLSRALKEPFTAPQHFAEIFERGIDPDVSDPTKCHVHSIVPQEWPKLDEIIIYRDSVRRRLEVLLNQAINPVLERALFISYEHEAMHLETILYMITQDESIGPISAFAKPISLLLTSERKLPANDWIALEGSLKIGINDFERNDESIEADIHGWDNESGSFIANIDKFSIQKRAIAVSEYFEFLQRVGFEAELIPASWIQMNNNWFVRSLFGPVPLATAGNWPVYVCLKQAEAYAKSQGCVLPTEEQLKLAQEKFPESIQDNFSFASLVPRDLQMHEGITDVCGNGWELTSTEFKPYPGFEQSKAYPGYSSDFFDGKHFVHLGGSWATVGDIALRRSFRNWYQRDYPYAFSKFRMVAK